MSDNSVEQAAAGSGPDPASSPDERACVEAALARSGGDKSRAARLLGWTAMNTEKTPCTQEETLEFGQDQVSWKKFG